MKKKIEPEKLYRFSDDGTLQVFTLPEDFEIVAHLSGNDLFSAMPKGYKITRFKGYKTLELARSKFMARQIKTINRETAILNVVINNHYLTKELP